MSSSEFCPYSGSLSENKKSEKLDKYSDLTREQKKKLNSIKATLIPIVVDALEKRLEEMEKQGRIVIIQTTALFKSTRFV